MIKVNKTILNLSDVVTNMTVADTLSVLGDFTEARKELQEAKDMLATDEIETIKRANDMKALGEQISYLDLNIKTLENAMLYHEAKSLEKRPTLKDLQILSLN